MGVLISEEKPHYLTVLNGGSIKCGMDKPIIPSQILLGFYSEFPDMMSFSHEVRMKNFHFISRKLPIAKLSQ